MEHPNANHDGLQQTLSQRDAVITPPNNRPEIEQSPSLTSSISIPTTVVRWQSPRPPQTKSSLQPPKLPLPPFQSPNVRSTATQKHNESSNTDRTNFEIYPAEVERESNDKYTRQSTDTSLTTHFCEVRISDRDIISNNEHNTNYTDLESRPPTPVDRTPYIRFALDQLTRTEDGIEDTYVSFETPSDDYPVDRILPDYGLSYTVPKNGIIGYPASICRESRSFDQISSNFDLSQMTPEKEREGLALTRKHRSSPKPAERLLSFYPPVNHEPESKKTLSKEPIKSFPIFTQAPEAPKVSFRYPELTFIPTILRPLSFFVLSCACIIMIALLSASRNSAVKRGFAPWDGKSSGKQFFLFRVTPQLLAGLIFVYIQCVTTAITRILPFVSLAANDPHERSEALFMSLYPTIFRPIRGRKLRINFCLCIYTLSILIIPLQSALITVTPSIRNWRWDTIEGIAWALTAIYTLIFGATVLSGFFFLHKTTGLMWDPRSLADIITMLPRSNALRDYSGTDILKSTYEIRDQLGMRLEKLGYWRIQNSPTDFFYCLGEEEASFNHSWKTMDRLSELTLGRYPDAERPAPRHDRKIRYRYIPWYMRDVSVGIWPVLGFIILVIILTLSFIPSTTLHKGFTPFSNGSPNLNSFSDVNFLFSFVPSLFGMLLYLLFQPLDMTLRVLKPWTELSGSEGATADESILLDYAAALPIQSSLSAISAGHYRIATTSFLSTLFILLPILFGALFSPVISQSSNIRIMPNLCVSVIILALLIMYLIGLLLFLSRHDRMYLPHGVTCLAEIISFFHNSHILEDAAFLNVRTKAELATRLLAERTSGGTHRWAFGVFRGRDGKESLGVERVGRSPGVGLMVLSEK